MEVYRVSLEKNDREFDLIVNQEGEAFYVHFRWGLDGQKSYQRKEIGRASCRERV